MVDIAGDFDFGYPLTAILYEGNITVKTALHTTAGSVKRTNCEFAAELDVGDYVGLHVDTANTYSATKGLPVVKAAAAAEGIIGIVEKIEAIRKMPSSDQSTWSTMLSSGYYRVARVIFFIEGAFVGTIDGSSTAVEVGAPLKYDVSAGKWVDNGTTFGGFFSFHYSDSATAKGLIAIAPGVGAGGTNDDCAGLSAQA